MTNDQTPTTGTPARDPGGPGDARAIDRLIDLARRRLTLQRVVEALERTVLPAAVLVLVLAVLDRLPVAEHAGFVPWTAVLPAVAFGAAVVVLVLARRRRPDRLDVAMLVDESLDLRGRIAAAVSLDGASGPFADAAVRDARAVATDPELPARLRRRLPVRTRAAGWMSPLALLLALGIATLVPPLGLVGGASEDEQALMNEVREARLDADEAVKAVAEQIDAAEALKAELGDDVPDLATPETPDELKAPEEIKRDALKQMTELKQRLDELVDGERGRRMEALEKMMEGLEDPGEGPARDLAKALRKGDFAAAKQALEELVRKAEENELSSEQQEQLAEQLKKLAEQMQKAAENQERLEEALRKAGLDPKLASNPEALQQAIRKASNLNEQQKQQLQQLAEAQAKACSQCNSLSNAMSAMAQAMQGGRPGQFGENGSMAMSRLSEMEQLQMMLQQAQAVMSQCQGQCAGLGQGMGMNGMPRPGQGGKRGPGGGRNPVQWAASDTAQKRVQVEAGEGEIIARMLVEGDPTVGESKAVAREVVRQAARGFDEALQEERIPPRYREAMRRYFGRLQEQAERSGPPPAPGSNGGE